MCVCVCVFLTVIVFCGLYHLHSDVFTCKHTQTVYSCMIVTEYVPVTISLSSDGSEQFVSTCSVHNVCVCVCVCVIVVYKRFYSVECEGVRV